MKPSSMVVEENEEESEETPEIVSFPQYSFLFLTGATVICKIIFLLPYLVSSYSKSQFFGS